MAQEAVAEVAEVAKTVVKVAAAPVIETVTQAATPVVEATARSAEATIPTVATSASTPKPQEQPSPSLAEDKDALISSLADKVRDLQAKTNPSQKSFSANPDVVDKSEDKEKPLAEEPLDQETAKTLQAVEKLKKLEADKKIIFEESRFKQILGEIASKETGNISNEELSRKAMVVFKQELEKQAAQDAQDQESATLMLEQKDFVKNEVHQAFLENRPEMVIYTDYASELLEAKAYEAKLKEQNAKAEEIAEASELVSKLNLKYETKLNDLIRKIRLANPRENPEKNPLVIILRNAPDNPDILNIMKKEKRKQLIEILVGMLGGSILSSLDESRKGALPMQSE